MVSVDSSSTTSTSRMSGTSDSSSTTPTDDSEMINDPDAVVPVIDYNAVFERHALYFVCMRRSYNLLGLLLAGRISAGADDAELDLIRNMRSD
eukprot:5494745-Heterocapsa_arctica.AAC.1